jgi:glycosyltransferase involved in cell wall biosynthesis
VNYNTVKQLDRFLLTLNSDMPDNPPWKAYVADNGSEDDSPDYLTGYNFPIPSTYIDWYLDENVGYAAACNKLASQGTGDIIGLLNSDVWMTTSDVMAIAKSFEDDPNVHILGPKQRDERGRITHAGIGGTNTAPKHRGWHMDDPHDIQFRDKVEMVTVSGSAFFVRRSTWEALASDEDYLKVVDLFVEEGSIPRERTAHLGPFLPTKHYYEETFCAYFARHRGYGVYYDGRISIGHSWHASHSKGSEADKYWQESQSLFRRACDMLGIEHD